MFSFYIFSQLPKNPSYSFTLYCCIAFQKHTVLETSTFVTSQRTTTMTHCRDNRRPPAAARSSRWGSSVKGWAAGSGPQPGAAACAGPRCPHCCCLGKTGGRKNIRKTCNVDITQHAHELELLRKSLEMREKAEEAFILSCHRKTNCQCLFLFVETSQLNSTGCKMTKQADKHIQILFPPQQTWRTEGTNCRLCVQMTGRRPTGSLLSFLSSTAVWLSVLITLLPPSWHAG